MLKVGLTGSIAVGKTFVTSVFEQLGVRVLDADKTARQVVEPGTTGLSRIVHTFGREVLGTDGTLDRKALGAIVFADSKEREKLNAIVHPLVIEAQNQWMAEQQRAAQNAIVLIDAALMIESGGYTRFDKLVVVWCSPEIQLQRLMHRDALAAQAAQERIAAQMSQDDKKRYADYLIDTSDGVEATRKQVSATLDSLRSISM